MYILAMLCGYGPQHGYGIRQRINALYPERYRISLASTYETLVVLHKYAYIVWDSPQITVVDKRERVMYAISERGMTALLDHFKDLNELMRIAATS